ERTAFRDHDRADDVDPLAVGTAFRCAAVDDLTDLTDRCILLLDAGSRRSALFTCGDEVSGVDGEPVGGFVGGVTDSIRQASSLTHRGHRFASRRCDGHCTRLSAQLEYCPWDV